MMQFASSARTGNESLRPENHDRDENDTKNQVANIAEGETRNEADDGIPDGKHYIGWISSQGIQLREDKLVNSVNGEGPNDDARNTADAANDHHSEENDR